MKPPPEKIEDYGVIQAGTILMQRFNDIKIRYIFIRLTEKNELELIPIYTRKNSGEKWFTPLFGLFAIAPKEEQVIGDFSTFDIEKFNEYLKAETA